ncbi:MAG: TetR/AcrR family transcriptional regulator [Alkalispirochaeta sp.]
MGSAERKMREKAALRRKIIAAASEVVSREGHEQLTIRKVAAAIEYSPRVIYLHFEDKDDLLRAIVEAGFERTLEERGTTPRDSSRSAEERVRRRLREHIEAALSDPNFYRAVVAILLTKRYPPGPAQQAVITEAREDLRELSSQEHDTAAQIEADLMIVFATLRGFTRSLVTVADHLAAEERAQLIESFIAYTIAGVRRERAEHT